MDYDVIYVDGRNAVTDHRTNRPQGNWRPLPAGPASGSRTIVVPPGARPTVITGAASGYYPPAAFQPAYAPAPSIGSRFGMTTGELIDAGIQVLAAIQPLPAAPTAQGEAGTDVENMVLLCRARHKVTYAEHRIMPRRSSLSTEVHVIFAA